MFGSDKERMVALIKEGSHERVALDHAGEKADQSAGPIPTPKKPNTPASWAEQGLFVASTEDEFTPILLYIFPLRPLLQLNAHRGHPQKCVLLARFMNLF